MTMIMVTVITPTAPTADTADIVGIVTTGATMTRSALVGFESSTTLN
jgi:hypothetical protein